MRAAFGIAWLALLPLTTACGSPGVAFNANGGSQGSGGKTTSSSTATGGTGGTTSTSSSGTGGSTSTTSSTSSSTFTTGTEPCPAAEPVNGTSCPGATAAPCTYKPYPCCMDDVAICDNGGWSITPGTCPATTCPASVPNNGDACGCPFATLCEYTSTCASANGMEQFALCTSGMWKVTSGACQKPMSVQCGASTCMTPGQVCVRVGTTTDVGCATNACPVGAIDCSCAHSVCPPDHPVCTGTDGPFVNCE